MNLFLLSVLLALDYTNTIIEQVTAGLVKLMPMLIPATVVTILKLIVENKKKKITAFNAITSWLAAVGVSYIFYPLVLEFIKDSFQPAIIAFIVLTGEKVITYFVYKFTVDDKLESLGQWLMDKIKKQ